jgi:hypothetical protein
VVKVLHDFRKDIADAERKSKGQGPDPLMAEALEWREAFAIEAGQGDGGPNSPDYVSTALEARYEELVRTESEERASAMVRVAAGKETPPQVLIDDWLTERAMRPRQSLYYRRAVSKLTTCSPPRVTRRQSKGSLSVSHRTTVCLRAPWRKR